jgi:hypothetical protein
VTLKAVPTTNVEPVSPSVDLSAAEQAAGELLAALGADLGRESLRETPRRIATLYSELLTPRDRALRRRDRGLPARTRAPRGDRKPLAGITSVAAFFVSRVDAKADARLSDDSPLRGKLGIANARAAYGLHQERFAGPAGKGSPSSAPRGKGPCGRAPRPKTPLTVTSSTWSSSRCRVRS